MKFTSIATGSVWHGPMYVHTLDRPFRLYQLDEFSVIGQLIQSSSTMGKTYVALFDENMQCVLLVHWGDSWVGSTKGYFNVYFYPQNGGSYYQQSGYIYSSFTKTGKLWWTSYPGGQGGIMASIDGSGDAYPIGECDNASRVIKYVGILGYRYSSYNLVDLRIHDINVVCDLNVHDPNAPSVPPPTQDPPSGEAVSCDGTPEGNGPAATADLPPETQQYADQNIGLEWLQSWWPTLQITVNVVCGLVSLTILLTVDILGSLNVVTSDWQIQGLDFDDPVRAQQIADESEQLEVNTAKSGLILNLATAALTAASWLVMNWVTFIVFCVALGTWHAAMFAHLYALYLNCENQHCTVENTLFKIWGIMTTWIMFLIGAVIRTTATSQKVLTVLERIFGKPQGAAMKAAKWMMILSAFMWLIAMVWETGQILAMQPMNAAFQAPSWVT